MQRCAHRQLSGGLKGWNGGEEVGAGQDVAADSWELWWHGWAQPLLVILLTVSPALHCPLMWVMDSCMEVAGGSAPLLKREQYTFCHNPSKMTRAGLATLSM